MVTRMDQGGTSIEVKSGESNWLKIGPCVFLAFMCTALMPI